LEPDVGAVLALVESKTEKRGLVGHIGPVACAVAIGVAQLMQAALTVVAARDTHGPAVGTVRLRDSGVACKTSSSI